MAGCGCSTTCSPTQKISPKFRRALWIALVLNALMFFVEIIGGSHARSVSLWADALDFAGDAANYAISLAVLSMTLYWRATAALLKGMTMAAFGVFVIVKVFWSWWHGMVPEPMLMGAIGVLALLVNVAVAVMLYAFRDGDANMRSVWLCSRNDAIANIAIIVAALGVLGTGTMFPDLFVAFIIAYLGVSSGYAVIRQSLRERKQSSITMGREA
ncbi:MULTISPECIES: cation transporter [Acinetobacter]|uniref:Cation transporter n=2 Tax=Acinetobacter TaxID=469 RepID=A0A372MQX6_ACIHA|nr:MULTISPECIES: cation transporter [Acinetobacter]NAR30918.1 cation transporter [Acinetobacter haemolyticus]NAR35866.1 cation transporter [Acinetobacter haemolyticus]NAR46790.1 cation transporter [Acinetobacter haemolyticus]NAR49163.1 cation transporter [Acinetobacter haemolyticus]NAR56634.1 cation transporter [Acinetobacter haemolyticus]